MWFGEGVFAKRFASGGDRYLSISRGVLPNEGGLIVRGPVEDRARYVRAVLLYVDGSNFNACGASSNKGINRLRALVLRLQAAGAFRRVARLFVTGGRFRAFLPTGDRR